MSHNLDLRSWKKEYSYNTFGPSKGLDIEVTMPCDNVDSLTKTFKNQK
jgi:hypothetical protein